MMYKTLEEIISLYRSKGRFSFTLDMLKEKMSLSEKAIMQALYRYRQKGRIAMIRKGFYVILEPEYTRHGSIPAFYYIEDMMQWLKRSYYLALFSAAALHGASHQQVMASYIMIQKPPMRSISNAQQMIYFIVSNQWNTSLLEQKKTDAGYVTISCSALTALDLVSFHKHASVVKSADTLLELAENIDKNNLSMAASAYKSTSAIQRLGYFFDIHEENALAGILQNELAKRNSHYIPLSVHQPRKGDYNKRWKVIENTEIATEI